MPLLVVLACDEPASSAIELDPTAHTTPTAGRPAAKTRAQLLALADARRLDPAFAVALDSPDVERRRAGALALARMHDPDAAGLLRKALRDPDPEVRRNGSLGLSALEHRAPRETERSLLGVLAAEDDPDTRVAMLWDLGRVGTDAAFPALRQALASDAILERAAACRALGAYGLRRQAVVSDLARRAGTLAADDGNADVRISCAYALTRVPPPIAEDRAIAADLRRASTDESPEVRSLAIRALGRYPTGAIDRLLEATSDSDWRVAVQGYRALAERQADGPFGRALRATVDTSLSDGAISSLELHVLRAALDAAAPMAKRTAVFDAAGHAHERLGYKPDSEPLSREQGLAHCAAAKLVDLGRGWPSRLDSCGLEQVETWERQVAMAEVLARVEGALPQRANYLARLYRTGTTPVRLAVVGALSSVDHPEADALLIRALGAEDAGIVAVACDAVESAAPRWKRQAEAVASVRPAGEPPSRGPSPLRQMNRALRGAYEFLSAQGEVEGLQSWAGAVAAVAAEGFLDELRQLSKHSNQAVRERAERSLRSMDQPVPDGVVEAVENAIDAQRMPVPGSRIVAQLLTSRGAVSIQLFPREAPSTVARFLELADAGFYDGLSFHRVVPAFVVQGGDPRGDGYGGPRWVQRCEDSRVTYARGTVGMALAGRDTGGSQFFITHSHQPHLDARYTAFGRVVSGMEAVDQIQQGDRIQSIRISR